MKLSANLEKDEHPAESIATEATVVLTKEGITEIHLKTEVKAAGLDKDKFDELVNDAKENCAVCKLFKAEIKVDVKLL